MTQMTAEEVRRIAKEVAYAIAPELINQALTRFGVNIEEPIALQQDMSYLRRLRIGATNIRMQVANAFILIFTGAGVVTMAQNAKTLASSFINNIHQ